MANPTHVQQYGNQFAVLMDDGTKLLAYPTTGSLWIINGTPGTPPPDPVDPGHGSGTVIYPCAEHRVSDSFADHMNRVPPSVNPGTDYIAPYGSDVWAVAAGTVTDVTRTNTGSGGRMIHIDHTALGTGSDYLHLSNPLVNVGDTVSQGQLIAKSGASGFGSDYGYGAHLHISYRTVLGHAYTNFHSIDFDAYIKSLP